MADRDISRDQIRAIAERIVRATCEPRLIESVFGNDEENVDARGIQDRYYDLTSNGIGFGESHVQARVEFVAQMLFETLTKGE
jgi:hypothetical protein